MSDLNRQIGGEITCETTSHHEQEIWNECARLVANAVVHYNAVILSQVLGELSERRDGASIEALKRVSAIAWQHVNFYGRYQFDSDASPIDFAALRSGLSAAEALRSYAA